MTVRITINLSQSMIDLIDKICILTDLPKGTHDLGRPEGAATRRVAFLKRSGAWEALDRMRLAQSDYWLRSGLIGAEVTRLVQATA